MNFTKNWSDAHSHLADPRMIEVLQSSLQEARGAGIGYFLQGGVGPEDWQRQKDLASNEAGIGLCFGLHPYWVADHSVSELELGLDQLARELGAAQALGETGLDLRPHILKDSLSRQLDAFEAQLELADFAHRPVVLHLVRAFDEALQVFEVWGVPKSKGFVHSFNGSVNEAMKYAELGLYLSVGGPVCRPDNQRLHQAVKEIPASQLLIESDSPDQAPPSLAGGLNRPISILEVAKQVASIRGTSREDILDLSSANLQTLLKHRV